MDSIQIKNNFEALFSSNKEPHLNYLDKYLRNQIQNIRPRMLHQHETDTEVLFILEGEGSYFIGQKSHFVQAGDLLVCNSKTDHESNLEFFKHTSLYLISISQINLHGYRENSLIADDADPVLHCQDQYQVIKGLFDIMAMSMNIRQEKSTSTCHYLMLALLTIILSYSADPDGHAKSKSKNARLAVQNMVHYIDEHFCEDINIREICDSMYVSVYYLSHIFKSEVGCSPMQYTIRRRIGKAQTLLETSRLSIAQIASSVGYADSNQFYALFFKHVGISPSKYREVFKVIDPTISDRN